MSDRRRRPTDDRQLDVNDLAAAIINQARWEWEGPDQAEYRSVCWGEERLGFVPCPFRQECYPNVKSRATASGPRYEGCIYRRNALKLELIEFLNSPWFGFLLGGVEPCYARWALGVPTL